MYRSIVHRETYIDILNRLGVYHERDRQTDRQTNRTAYNNSVLYM